MSSVNISYPVYIFRHVFSGCLDAVVSELPFFLPTTFLINLKIGVLSVLILVLRAYESGLREVF
jgi:hypothetical protein